MKITYLFGAGASINALPIVSEIPQKIDNMIKYLEMDEFELSDSNTFDFDENISKRSILQKLIDDLKWLLEKSKNHASIDTYAKKLRIREQYDDLWRMKNVFSVFLILEQTKNNVDLRYDSFFASLLNGGFGKFPSNVRILSWNYDFQFEKAYVEYSGENSIYSNQIFLNQFQKNSNEFFDKDNFSMMKLNGSTNIIDYSQRRQYAYFDKIESKISKEFFEEILSSYHKLDKRIADRNLMSSLSFAWENDLLGIDIVETAKEITNDTEVLVVIGYSFPYFNREIDRKIIGNMLNLKKVYIQSPDADGLKERFYSLRPGYKSDNIICVFDTKQFFLPNEL